MAFVSKQERVVGPALTDWTNSVTFDQVDPALGIQSVGLGLTATLYVDASIRNNDLDSVQYGIYGDGSATVERADGTALLTTVLPVRNFGTLGPAGSTTAQQSVRGLTASARDSFAYVAGQAASADAALFIGTGRLALPVTASARIGATLPGNTFAVFDSAKSGR